jgi:hypothetical protein
VLTPTSTLPVLKAKRRRQQLAQLKRMAVGERQKEIARNEKPGNNPNRIQPKTGHEILKE